jgi:hypothetical protein
MARSNSGAHGLVQGGFGLSYVITGVCQTSRAVALQDGVIAGQTALFNTLLFDEHAIVINFSHRVTFDLH